MKIYTIDDLRYGNVVLVYDKYSDNPWDLTLVMQAAFPDIKTPLLGHFCFYYKQEKPLFLKDYYSCSNNTQISIDRPIQSLKTFFKQLREYKKSQMKPQELKITKDKVLEASKNCPQAKETLKTLFPEVFKNKI